MSNEIMKLSKDEVKALALKSENIDLFNRKLQMLRKRQLAVALKDSTEIRIDIMKKIKKWLDILETRVFDPEIIAEMKIERVIGLFKFVGKYSIDMLSQINDMEDLFKSYTETLGKLESIEEKPKTNVNQEEIDSMKKNIMKSFMDTLKKTSEETTIIKQNQFDATKNSLPEDVEILDPAIQVDALNITHVPETKKGPEDEPPSLAEIEALLPAEEGTGGTGDEGKDETPHQ